MSRPVLTWTRSAPPRHLTSATQRCGVGVEELWQGLGRSGAAAWWCAAVRLTASRAAQVLRVHDRRGGHRGVGQVDPGDLRGVARDSACGTYPSSNHGGGCCLSLDPPCNCRRGRVMTDECLLSWDDVTCEVHVNSHRRASVGATISRSSRNRGGSTIRISCRVPGWCRSWRCPAVWPGNAAR